MAPSRCTAALLIAALVCGTQANPARVGNSTVFDIRECGAVPGDASLATAQLNGRAVVDCVMRANATSSASSPATVLVPAGLNFTMIPAAPLAGVSFLTLRIDGSVLAFQPGLNISVWPNNTPPFMLDSHALDVFFFGDSHDITITGEGVIDGQGYDWWWLVLLAIVNDDRPNLIGFQHCENVSIVGLHMRNSPCFHVYASDVLHMLVDGVDIRVDVTAQSDMLRRAGRLTTGERFEATRALPPGPARDAAWSTLRAEVDALTAALEAAAEDEDAEAAVLATGLSLLPAGIPVFPLNTDGIDIAGRDVVIRNSFVENFDDAYCVKPLNAASGAVAGPCSQDYLIVDSVVSLGVGLTIGSVPPDGNVNCVSNITFRNITSITPIKGIYVKPNPGGGTNTSQLLPRGIIDSVTYEDITMTGALWWAVYVGTQQQDQPGGGADTGCSFFYPLPNTTCPPQPRVPVTNLRFINVTSTDSLLSPGLLTCAPANETGPWGSCDGWEFSNVTMTSLTNWPNGPGFFCEGDIQGQWNNVSPLPTC